MIRHYFGLDQDPFSLEDIELLPHQQEIFDTLQVHSRQGGLCLLMGEPGTGKSIIKETIKQQAGKRSLVTTIGRTLHTYINTLKILCEAFHVDFQGADFKCEKRLIDEAASLNRQGKSLITIIDDAHLMEMRTVRKLRLLFADFPKNHNLILVAQPQLLQNMALRVNEDLRSRVTFSTIVHRLTPDHIKEFIFSQLDRIQLGHHTFQDDALDLIARSCEGVLRKARNLCLSCLLQAVREQKKQVSLSNVNRVLLQPHWRVEYDLDQK
jgi:type II secretory pathway predicted ATPase ExeA